MKREDLLKPFIIAVSVILVFLSYSSIGTVRAEQPDYSAMYEFSGGEIKGFKSSYLDSLPDENGYKYVDIVIPDSIGGIPVTGIGDSAFLGSKSEYAKVRAKHIDLSSAKHLQTVKQYAFYAMGSMYSEMENCTLTLSEPLQSIGSNAFSGQSSLTGSLTLPDTVTEITDSAFMNCGFNGTLKLPDNPLYTQVKKQVFEHCSFQGTLTIPQSITSLSSNGNYAFAYNDFTEVILNNQITSIGGSTFKDCKLLNRVKVAGKTDARTIVLPDVLTNLGNMIFQNCAALEGSVKIPDRVVEAGSEIFEGTKLNTIYMPNNSSVTYKSNFLFNTAVNAAVFPSKELYDQYLSGFSSGSRRYFSYPVTVTFKADDGQTMGTRDALYNRPLHYHETDNGWVEQTDFEFPGTGESTAGYDTGFSFTKGGKVIKASDLVTGDVLYYSKSVSVPEIDLKEVSRKTYDGKTEYISCEASHPLAGEDGPYTFLYCVLKAGEGSFFYVSDKPFVYPVKDVKDSAQYVCYVQMYDKAHPEYRGKWDKSEWYDYFATQVVINKADPSVNPVYPDKALEGTALSDLDLKLAQGDTPGTLEWKEDTVVVKGDNVLEWRFVPDDMDNYKSDITGQVTVTGVEHFLPVDIEQGIGLLPDEIENEQDARNVLNLWRQYTSIDGEQKEGVDKEQKMKLLEMLAQVPNIEVKNESKDMSSGLEAGQESLLLSGITGEDAQELLDGTTQKIQMNFKCEKAEQIPDEISQSIEGVLNGYQCGAFYNIILEKRFYAGSSDMSPSKQEQVTELELPLRLSFALQEDMKAPEGKVRKYTVLRTHGQPGVRSTTMLDSKEKDGKIITESKLFSIYTLAYKESEKETSQGSQTTAQGSQTTVKDNQTTEQESKTTALEGRDSNSPSDKAGSTKRVKTSLAQKKKPAATGDDRLILEVYLGIMTAAVLLYAVVSVITRKRGRR